MNTPDTKTGPSARMMEPIGKAALIASVGGTRGYADWTNPGHRLRRLLSEFIGMAGLTFVLSGGAAILVRYGGRTLQPWQTVLVLSLVSALWLVVAVYLIGPVTGAVIAVGVAHVLRGPARAQEASAAQGTPLDRQA
jgi:aquaporin Z